MQGGGAAELAGEALDGVRGEVVRREVEALEGAEGVQLQCEGAEVRASVVGELEVREARAPGERGAERAGAEVHDLVGADVELGEGGASADAERKHGGA